MKFVEIIKSSNMNLEKANELYKEKLIQTYKAFVDFCITNNLNFCAAGGTMIGAVRHKGIIPWDDDIDIFMPRKDYDRFLKLKEKASSEGFEIVDWETKGYTQPFAKFCDACTTIIPSKDSTFLYGIFIDVFPLDKNHGSIKSINIKCFIYRNALRLYAILNCKINCRIKAILKPLNYLINWYETHIFLGELFCSPLGVYKEKEISTHEVFSKFKKVPFEDSFIFIPVGFHKYLTQVYGDYMQLPPLEKRVSHHALYYVNFNRRISLNEISQLVDDEQGIFFERSELKNAYKY